MISINLDKIKKIRKITGISVIECKKALINSKGNINKAIHNMREKGLYNSIRKKKKHLKEGIILIKIKNQIGVIIKLNCETDFTSSSYHFKKFSKKLINYSIKKNINDINFLKLKYKNKINNLINKIKENISIKKFNILKGKNLFKYIHYGNKIGVIISTSGNNDKKINKKIAMHIAASKPIFIKKKNISKDIIEKEKNIQIKIYSKFNKNRFILKKIVKGKIKKFISKICLYEQNFIFDTSKLIKEILKINNIKIINFIRFEI